jgi:hypothetical protein
VCIAGFWPKASYKRVIWAIGGLGWALAPQLLTVFAVKPRTNAERKAQEPVVILFLLK